jgi:hypothetical protein
VQITEPYAALSHVPYLVFRTTDAGRSWTLEYREGYTLGSTTPLGTPALGSYPSLMGALRDGTTWVLTCSPPTDVQDLVVLDRAGAVLDRQKAPFIACAHDASAVDARHVWAIDTEYRLEGTQVASRTRLMRTMDGGRTWSRADP